MNIPNVPNFNSNPAKIIEPSVGASTCASGNQTWNGKIGILTANGKNKQILYNCKTSIEKTERNTIKSKKLSVLIWLYKINIKNKNNSDPQNVNKNNYIAALIRRTLLP